MLEEGGRAVLRTAVIAVTLLLLAGCAEPDASSTAVAGASPPEEGTAAPGGRTLAAPEGMRWVGMNDVVVAVPQGWGTATQPCEEPDGDTVAFLGADSTVLDCATLPTQGVSSLRIAAAESGSIPLGRRTDLTARAGGLRVLHSGVSCSPGACETTFLVRGAAFQVVVRGAAGRSAVEAVRDSVTLLPDGMSTVPFVEYGTSFEDTKQLLSRAELSIVEPDVNFPYYVTATEPPAGSVVEEGTEVAVVIGDG